MDVLEKTENCCSCRELNSESASLVTTQTALCRVVSSDGCRNKQNTAWPCDCIVSHTHNTFRSSPHNRSQCEPKICWNNLRNAEWEAQTPRSMRATGGLLLMSALFKIARSRCQRCRCKCAEDQNPSKRCCDNLKSKTDIKQFTKLVMCQVMYDHDKARFTSCLSLPYTSIKKWN